MGKPYNHCYHFSGYRGTTGTMICAKCNQPIFNHAQDWMSYVKPHGDDWGYVCLHRKCCDDQTPWIKIEQAEAAEVVRHKNNLAMLTELAKALKITDPLEFASLAAEALGMDDLDGEYFMKYGSG